MKGQVRYTHSGRLHCLFGPRMCLSSESQYPPNAVAPRSGAEELHDPEFDLFLVLMSEITTSLEKYELASHLDKKIESIG